MLALREKERFDLDGDFFGETNANKAAGGNGVAVSYEARRLLCADDLSAIQRLYGRKRQRSRTRPCRPACG